MTNDIAKLLELAERCEQSTGEPEGALIVRQQDTAQEDGK